MADNKLASSSSGNDSLDHIESNDTSSSSQQGGNMRIPSNTGSNNGKPPSASTATTSMSRAPMPPPSPLAAAVPGPADNRPRADSIDRFAAAVQQSYDAMNQGDGKKEVPSVVGGVEASDEPGDLSPFASPMIIKKPDHSRSVSWGIATSSQPPNSSTKLPTLKNAPSSIEDDKNDDDTASASITKQHLDMADVLNVPVHTETEAETYILQAVEKFTSHHRVTSTATSKLYNTIIEDEITATMVDDHRTPVVPTKTNASTSSSNNMDHSETANSRQTLTKQPSQSTMSSTSRFKAFVSLDATQHARKNTTVEGTLFGLATALNELHEVAADVADISETPSEDDDAIAYDTRLTAGDKLVEAAQQMADEQKDKEGNTVDNNNAPANSSGLEVASGGPVDNDPTEVAGNVQGSSPDDVNNDDKKKRKHRHRRRKNRLSMATREAASGMKGEWELFNSFFSSRKDQMKKYVRNINAMIMLPCLGMAFFLFYVVENPDVCPVRPNSTKAETTLVPSFPPTMAPTLDPTVAPTDSTLDISVAWLEGSNNAGNDTLLDFMGNDSLNGTLPNITQAPKETLKEAVNEFITCPGLGASVSWWFLFLGVRQVLTFTLALITQAFIIDYLALSSRFFLVVTGPIVTLLIVQSKGWPFILTFWAIYDLALVHGDSDFAHHWGYWQDWVGLFNEENPSGNVVDNEFYHQLLVNAMLIGICVAVKRLVVGLMLGRSTFVHYGEQLATVMKNMVLIGEVATLARQIENEKDTFREMFASSTTMSVASGAWNAQAVQNFVSEQSDSSDEDKEEPVTASAADAANAFMANRESKAKKTQSKSEVDPAVASFLSSRSFESVQPVAVDPEFTESQQVQISGLLDAWEEPSKGFDQEEKRVTIAAVLQFRQALTFMKRKYPFLPVFGPADTREACIESSQKVYDKLLFRTPQRDVLPFETLALLAKTEDGSLDQVKAKELIRIFRPDRDGALGKLEFVKSIDVIYKELRLLSANISNSSQMDAAVEKLVNVGFYLALGAVIVYRFGGDPLALFLSFSSIILAFAFMFGKSSAKFFDGCMFILNQRPYGVGDRMHLSNPALETSPDGSSGWIVEKVSLFTTSVYWGATNERATLCNGAISNLRVINAARSPNAIVYVNLKFGIDTEYEKIEIFRSAVEHYLKDRPREWLAFLGFRPGEVATERGFIGYKIIAQHRNNWQGVGGIIESKANLTTYCLEVAKQLGIRYVSPALPVNLTIKDDPLELPMLGENGDDKSEPSAALIPPQKRDSTLSMIREGLRQRKGSKLKFADIVRAAVEANTNK